MSSLVLLAADVSGPVRPGVVRSSGVAYDLLLVFGAGVLLFGVLLLWAAYFRRQRSRHRHPRHHHHQSTSSAASAAEHQSVEREEADSAYSRHRRRRRRREHRGRNPTLSETGGLPPPRADGALPPAA
jgi:ABC-type nickel/cobalt efflux system permease component RcnA